MVPSVYYYLIFRYRIPMTTFIHFLYFITLISSALLDYLQNTGIIVTHLSHLNWSLTTLLISIKQDFDSFRYLFFNSLNSKHLDFLKLAQLKMRIITNPKIMLGQYELQNQLMTLNVLEVWKSTYIMLRHLNKKKPST